MSEDAAHVPVMLQETLEALKPRSGGVYVDVTAGAGGHSEAILEASAPDGQLLAMDRDPSAIAMLRSRLARFGSRVRVLQSAMSEIQNSLKAEGIDRVDGVLADLGVSSMQLDQAARGFSFQASGPIDMRMNPDAGHSALEMIAHNSAETIGKWLRDYGDERRAFAIGRSIRRAYEAGELSTTDDLRRAVIRVTGPRRSRIDPATRTFQALRIATNDELGELQALLHALPAVLREGGVAVIISFHSLEDRAVKHFVRDSRELEALSRKPLVAGEGESEQNPRARSAKLRAAKRIVELES